MAEFIMKDFGMPGNNKFKTLFKYHIVMRHNSMFGKDVFRDDPFFADGGFGKMRNFMKEIRKDMN